LAAARPRSKRQAARSGLRRIDASVELSAASALPDSHAKNGRGEQFLGVEAGLAQDILTCSRSNAGEIPCAGWRGINDQRRGVLVCRMGILPVQDDAGIHEGGQHVHLTEVNPVPITLRQQLGIRKRAKKEGATARKPPRPRKARPNVPPNRTSPPPPRTSPWRNKDGISQSFPIVIRNPVAPGAQGLFASRPFVDCARLVDCGDCP